jgi:Holin of 3TMs, for gene-transfer release
MNPLVFGVLGKVIDTISNFVDPTKKAEAALAVMKLEQDGLFKEIETELAYAKQQNDINLEQAKSESLFVSGPRPFLMWIGGLGCAYQWLVVPIGSFGYQLYTGAPLPVAPPTMDPSLMAMMGSLMGLQIGFRSWEKVKRA